MDDKDNASEITPEYDFSKLAIELSCIAERAAKEKGTAWRFLNLEYFRNNAKVILQKSDIFRAYFEEKAKNIAAKVLINGMREYNQRLQAIIDKQREALEFYRDNFEPYQYFKHLPGLSWKPTEELLADCGNIAKEALALTETEEK